MLGPLGFFVLVLTGVVWLTQSLRIIDLVVNNGQGARVFLEFSALLLPVVLSIVLQLGGLAATVYMPASPDHRERNGGDVRQWSQ